MSFYESLPFSATDSLPKARPTLINVTPNTDPAEQLTDALVDVFVARKTETAARGTRRGRAKPELAIILTGQLIGAAAEVYPIIAERFRAFGYTAMLERYKGDDVVIAVPGIAQVRAFNPPWWIHLVLLLVTIVSTVLAGAEFGGYMTPSIFNAINHGRWALVGQALSTGVPFALTLLLILGVHEMGHYVAARRHNVAVTLPFFIPLPLISLLGTLGAVIFIKSALNNRKALFDVGLSGPLAGLVVALVAFAIGLKLPTFSHPYSALQLFNAIFGGEGSFQGLGIPPLLDWLGHAVVGANVYLPTFVVEHPVALAAWFGVLLTVLNLLPIGQLDGGHVTYTLFGRAALLIAVVMFGALLYIGFTTFPSFLFYALLALLTGLRHPPPADDITPLNPARRFLGFGTIILFFLIATATPFITN
jgi:membrane-associated protease RseP (regulator of RpoE activity)